MDTRDRGMFREILWEEARGKLLAMLHTFYDQPEEYDRLNDLIEEFIDNMDDEMG